MKFLFFKSKYSKFFAKVILVSFAYQIFFPLASLALTSGPSQPEMQTFEPVGTTDMVNTFTGDFNYNIPLLDIEGYPVNIAYHAGITSEQEASWVGLGWNINPGNINHIVRGLSDDYNGEQIEKVIDATPEKSSTFQIFAGVEFSGLKMENLDKAAKEALKSLKNVGASSQTNFGITINNYSGLSAFLGQSGQASYSTPWISPGVGMGTTVSTDRGVDFDYSFFAQAKIAQKNSDGQGGMYGGLGVSGGGGLNSREGMKYHYLGASASVGVANKDKSGISFSGNTQHTFIPTGLQNYVPIVTNTTSMKSSFFQVKIGAEVYLLYPFGGGSYSVNKVSIEKDGTRRAFGYNNLEKATEDDLLDFARERDGNINRKTKFLPLTNLTYDIYAVNAHGAGGSFRPHRTDIGAVYDPAMRSDASDERHLTEYGIANIFEAGYDLKTANTYTRSGVWGAHRQKFSEPRGTNNLGETYYMKQAGELTEGNDYMHAEIEGKRWLTYEEARTILKKDVHKKGDNPRTVRANLLYPVTAEDAGKKQISLLPQIINYKNNGFNSVGSWNPEVWTAQDSRGEKIDRFNSADEASKKKISQYVQIQPDGRTYIFGLPVKNINQKDFEVSNLGTTEVTEFDGYDNGMPKTNVPNPEPSYISKTVLPEYPHSYMLTSVLSTDYVDLTGNGISDDDLGTFTKLNYSKKENYNWRVPYGEATGHRMVGLKSDCKDDRLAFSSGVREQWMLHSIESRNMVAEFYTSQREDGLGSTDAAIFGSGTQTHSYKLDSIVLFNKHERFSNNPANATRLKTIVFYYDYALCRGVPNNKLRTIDPVVEDYGKLTLKSIFVKEGNSHIGYLSPYQFKYSSNNPVYDQGTKDCWGHYKPVSSNQLPNNTNLSLTNTQFPYVNQNDPSLDQYASAWNLTEITLPSGGRIKVTYEADDYGFVQDREAMEMFKVMGVGPSRSFHANNTLYADPKDPYLYVYFKRKIAQEQSSIANTYVAAGETMQFIFDVRLSPHNNLGSCLITPLTETVKGYANVVESGVCDNNSDYGYIKLEPKTPSNLISLEKLDIPGVKVNPISLAAINLARYRNPKLLNPEADIPNQSDGAELALINALISSMADNINIFSNPIKTYLKQNKAKSFEIGKSVVRLKSPGLKKKGGGHRVKKLEFFDTWGPSSSEREASFGSEYEYTTIDGRSGAVISSGVASYEPLFGGDENPCRGLIDINESGNGSKFPPVDPVELMVEAPLGESQYPPASVGYSKVTVRSLHRNSGETSQAIQRYEYYTAKDFPVTYTYSDLDVLEDKPTRIWQIKHKKEIYRVAQGYSLELNDMHGKPLRTSTSVLKYNPAALTANPNSEELVAYTEYDYFTNPDKTLKNHDIPCLDFAGNGEEPILIYKTLGEDIDITFDSREKVEHTDFFNFSFNVNCFVAPAVPISIPLGFPTQRKQTKTFSSFVNTKVIQKYGILKEVRNYNKGALIIAENTAFDHMTGEALVTTVNTEFGDEEMTVKYPAYWAQRGMGHAYENIGYERNLLPSKIRDGKAYLSVGNPDDFNLGDELELTATDMCVGSDHKTYKLWVVGKNNPPSDNWTGCTSYTCASSTNPLMYKPYSGPCITPTDLMNKLKDITKETGLGLIQEPIEYARVTTYPSKPKLIAYRRGKGNCGLSVTEAFFERDLVRPAVTEEYMAEVHHSYSANIIPYKTNYTCTLKCEVYDKMNVTTAYGFDGPNRNYEEYYKKADIVIVYSNTQSILPTFPSYLWGYYAGTYGGTTSNYFNNNFTSIIGGREPCGTEINITKGITRSIFSGQTVGNYRPIPNTDPAAKALVAVPYNVNAKDIIGSAWGTTTFPTNDNIVTGKVKVIRSGKRNQLTQSAQEVTFRKVQNWTFLGYSSSWSNVINASARRYHDAAQQVDYGFDYFFNPYIKGQKGNYRVVETYNTNQRRKEAHNLQNLSLKESGTHMYGLSSFWKMKKQDKSDDYNNRMVANLDQFWRSEGETVYSVWGMPLQVSDALRHTSAVQYDFGQTVPVATISNAGMGDFMFESFEDARWIEKYKLSPLNTSDNPFKQWIRDNISSSLYTNGVAKLLVNEDRHTGNNAMEFLQTTQISVPVVQMWDPLIPWQSFHVWPNSKYIFSYWQKTNANGAPVLGSSVFVTGGTVPQYLAALTPVIDGWVLYEREIDLPVGATSFTINIPAGTVMDDIRIFPKNSNMKSYVYDDQHRRLSAVLDENHIATIFEYDDKGKLARIKKETEKGKLTIKESREALKNILSNGPYGEQY